MQNIVPRASNDHWEWKQTFQSNKSGNGLINNSMGRNGNRVVFDTSGSYIEKKMTKGILWLWEIDGVYVVDVMVVPPGREQEGQPLFCEGHEGLLSPNELTEEHGMWDRGGVHAMDDDEQMDEDMEETDSEKIGDEEQEEEHQTARALVSPDLPSRREAEDLNSTHSPFRKLV